MALQHLRSGVANKRPIPTIMSEGQIALNTNEASPGLFFKDSNGDLVKIGPVHIGTSAPNSSPASTAATALVTGATYQILTVGTSDFTAVGASANTVGTVFTATGTTTGTGTVSGQQGVEKGEQWLDTTGGNYVLKIYDGTAWRSEAGEFVNVSGDTMTGALLLDNAASVSAPDLSFDGDANTGIYSPGADQFGVATGGTAALTIDSSQNVGIGTTSPSAELHVATSADNGGLVLHKTSIAGSTGAKLSYQLTNTGSSAVEIASIKSDQVNATAGNETGNLLFSTTNSGSASEKMRIDSSGNVAIGTSTALTSSGFTGVTASGSSGGIYWFAKAGAQKGYIYGGDNDVTLASTDASGVIRLLTGGNNERMRIDSSGNVGIGTPTPSQKLHVVSTSVNSVVIQRSGAGGGVKLDLTNGDNNTWDLFNDGGELFNLRYNDSAKVVVNASNYVGIGTTSPISELHVENSSGNCGARVISGTSGVSYLNLGDTADNNIGSIEYDNAINALKIITNNNERMRIDSSGRVGIGTTSQGSLNGDANKLVVGSGSGSEGLTIFSGNASAGNIFFADSTSAQHQGVIQYDHNGDYMRFMTAGYNERMRIDSSGRLLVGTSSSRGVGSGTQAGFQVETDASQVVGSFVVNYPSTTGAIIGLAKSRSNSVGGSGLVQNDDDLGLIRFIGADGTDLQTVAASIGCQVDGTPGSNDMPGRLVFSTNPGAPATGPTERMRITSGGVINTFSTETTGVFNVRYSSGSGSNVVFACKAGATDTTTGSDRFRVRGDGDCENTNNSYGAISDIKLKENIVDANSQWSDIKALQVRNYSFKEETNYGTHTQIGLVAQEVETVSPGLVSESPDLDDDGNDLGTVTKSVNYSVLYMKAVKALQEAMKRIETLEASNTDLLARVSALESA